MRLGPSRSKAIIEIDEAGDVSDQVSGESYNHFFSHKSLPSIITQFRPHDFGLYSLRLFSLSN